MSQPLHDDPPLGAERDALVARAAEALAAAARGRPRVAIILGSGLSAVADVVTPVGHLAYAELPGFPRPTVAGHSGQVTLGRIHDLDVAILQGLSLIHI